jgi:hypothetical protein
MTVKTDAYLKFFFTEDLYVIQDSAGPVSRKAKVVGTQQIQSAATDISVGEPALVKYLGANKKGILILVHDNESEFLNQKDYDFLIKIVEGGLKMTKTDIAVVNCQKYVYNQIFDEINHQYLIAFGDHAASSVGENTKYEVYKHHGKNVLLADDLRELQPSKEKKTLLWKALQLMFDIK